MWGEAREKKFGFSISFGRTAMTIVLAILIYDRYYYRNTNLLSIPRSYGNSNDLPEISSCDSQKNP